MKCHLCELEINEKDKADYYQDKAWHFECLTSEMKSDYVSRQYGENP